MKNQDVKFIMKISPLDITKSQLFSGNTYLLYHGILQRVYKIIKDSFLPCNKNRGGIKIELEKYSAADALPYGAFNSAY
jgi:hypothetical protein